MKLKPVKLELEVGSDYMARVDGEVRKVHLACAYDPKANFIIVGLYDDDGTRNDAVGIRRKDFISKVT